MPGLPCPVSANENPLGALPGSSLSKLIVTVSATSAMLPATPSAATRNDSDRFIVPPLASFVYSTRQGDMFDQPRKAVCAQATVLSVWQPVQGFATLNVSVIDGVMKANV